MNISLVFKLIKIKKNVKYYDSFCNKPSKEMIKNIKLILNKIDIDFPMQFKINIKISKC